MVNVRLSAMGESVVRVVSVVMDRVIVGIMVHGVTIEVMVSMVSVVTCSE